MRRVDVPGREPPTSSKRQNDVVAAECRAEPGRARLIVLAVVLGTLVTVAGPGQPASACSCVGIGMAEAIADAEVAFVGTTDTRFGDDEWRDEYEWRFDVTESLKGEARRAHLGWAGLAGRVRHRFRTVRRVVGGRCEAGRWALRRSWVHAFRAGLGA